MDLVKQLQILQDVKQELDGEVQYPKCFPSHPYILISTKMEAVLIDEGVVLVEVRWRSGTA